MAGLRRRVAVLGLAILGLALMAVPASATTVFTHTFVKSFEAGASNSSTGSTSPFGNVDHVAIDQSNGAVYVLDNGLGVITKFDSEGNPFAFSGLGPGVNSI